MNLRSEVGFFEESAGVRSMSRLTMGVLLLLAAMPTATLCWYVVVTTRAHIAGVAGVTGPEGAIIAALTAAIGAFVVNGIVAIYQRNGGES